MTKLTDRTVTRLACPPDQQDVIFWDDELPNFGLRCYRSGNRVYLIQYRANGGGRRAPTRRFKLGDATTLDPKEARRLAKAKLGLVAAGGDPAAERDEERRKERAQLDKALDRYEADLKRRGVVGTGHTMSVLRRGLAGLGPDVADLTRTDLMERVEKLEKDGKVGAAAALRTRSAGFLNWAANAGLIPANPLAGLRRTRATRQQRTAQVGRALTDAEIKTLWLACDKARAPFGDYLRFLLLTGQRRLETAMMRWADLDLEAEAGARWTIPAATTKNGVEHLVPLPDAARAIVERQSKLKGCEYVFAGRAGQPLTGWSKRIIPVHNATLAAKVSAWTIHDLRRTFRSGLTRLGVGKDIAELMLNHRRADLLERYDRETRWSERKAAAMRWAEHVTGLVTAPDRSNVVVLPHQARG
jgi:integrase